MISGCGSVKEAHAQALFRYFGLILRMHYDDFIQRDFGIVPFSFKKYEA